jgi:ribose 5-phosphate isomerase B
MVIYFGADHRGFPLKQALIEFVKGMGYEVADMGAHAVDSGDDYPDFARAVAVEISRDPENRRGILICGSGIGMDITANKFRGVRSGLGFSTDQVYSGRHDDDINVLSLAADYVSPEDAQKIVRVFLTTPLGTEERRKRRLQKIPDGGA